MVEICGDAEVKKATFEAVRIGRDEPLEFLQVSYLILSWSRQTRVIHVSCRWKLDHSAGASYVNELKSNYHSCIASVSSKLVFVTALVI